MYKLSRARFTEEFKREAVRLVEEGKRSQLSVARELGIQATTLANWLKAKQAGRLRNIKVVTPVEMEYSRLRAENARLKMEVEILKKAAAYFAKESL